MYEKLENSTGLKFCVFNAIAGVGRSINERDLFRRIFQNQKIEYYKCPHCVYIAIGKENDILFKDVSNIENGKHGLYLKLLDGKRIPINRQTFSIRCTRKECINPEAWVNTYIPPVPKEKETKQPDFKLVESTERQYYD